MKTPNIETKPAHTPTPWLVAEPDHVETCLVCRIGDVAISTKAENYGTQGSDLGDAALIVRAVNSHAELVATLEMALERLTSANGRLEARGRLGYRTDDLTAALAKAKGQP